MCLPTSRLAGFLSPHLEIAVLYSCVEYVSNGQQERLGLYKGKWVVDLRRTLSQLRIDRYLTVAGSAKCLTATKSHLVLEQ